MILKNVRWEKFAQSLVNGNTKRGAAVAAGYKDNASTTKNVHKLLSNPVIADRIDELQQELAKEYLMNRQELLVSLGRIIKQGSDNNVINAVKLSAHMQGFLTNTMDIHLNRSLKDMSDEELLGILDKKDD